MQDVLNNKKAVIEYINSNLPSSPEELYRIIYTFGLDGSDVEDILDIFTHHYGETKEVAQKMVVEYREFYRVKKLEEKKYQKEREREEMLEEIRLEMDTVSSNPEQFKKLDIERFVEKWQQKVKPAAPIPKIINFLECEPEAREIILSIGYINVPKGVTCCVHAQGGTGKSLLMQRVIMASGIRACYISGEDSAGRMASLLQPYKRMYSSNNADFVHFDNQNMDGVLEFISTSEYQLYVIDPLSSFCTGDKWSRVETENGVAAELLRLFNGITAKSGKTIIYTHHEAKSSGDIRTAARGSSALVDNARMGISINRMSERYKKPHSSKSNRYEEQEEHARNIRMFQRELHSQLKRTNHLHFRNQEMIGVIEMVCHKNNYGKVGDKAEFIFTANMGRSGLNVVPAGDYQIEINTAVNESFRRQKNY